MPDRKECLSTLVAAGFPTLTPSVTESVSNNVKLKARSRLPYASHG